MVFEVALFTLAVVHDVLDHGDQKGDADAGPDAQKEVDEKLGQSIYGICFHRGTSNQARKSSSASVPKSDAALDLPPRGSPSRIFWRLFKPQAMPLFPLLLKA